MHFTGTIWRPPYEAASLLLEVTAGCTHHKCKFCTLYDDLPFPFRMSPLEDIEADLLEAQTMANSPLDRLAAALQGLPAGRTYARAFLTGANPFVLKTNRLLEISRLIGQYFPSVQSVGCFARVTDIGLKTDGELEKLDELRTLISRLEIPATFAALGASNAFNFQGRLPEDRDKLLDTLDRICRETGEQELRVYRETLPHL